MHTTRSACIMLAATALLCSDAVNMLRQRFCSTPNGFIEQYKARAKLPGSGGFMSAAYGQTPTNACAPPSAFQSLPEVSGAGDLTVPLAVTLGTGIGASPALCDIYRSRSGSVTFANPVIRVQQGQHLAVRLTNTVANDSPNRMVNCKIQTFVDGGDCTQPEAAFQSLPGPDDPFYPIQAAVPMLADGVTNLHTHGFAVSPLPCHDEVIESALYPPNWSGVVEPLLPCQPAPNALNYTYDIPPNHPAGAYWYHAHRHGQEQAMQMMGESGAIVIEGDQDRMRAARGVTDEVLLIRDIPSYLASNVAGAAPLQSHRQMMNRSRGAKHVPRRPPSSGASIDPRVDRSKEVTCASTDPDSGGPEVTRLTLNGALVPEADAGFPSDAQVLTKTMQAGERQLWRIVNGSSQNAIIPQLTLVANGVATALPLTIVARDGVPLHKDDGRRYQEVRDTTANPLVIPEAGRLEIVVHAPPRGAKLYLDSLEVKGGCASDGNPVRRLLRVVSQGQGAFAGNDSDIQASGEETEFVRMLSAPVSVSRTFAFTEFPRDFTVATSRWRGAAPGAGQFDPTATDFFINMIASSDGQGRPVAVRPFEMHGPSDVVVHLRGRESVVEEWLVQNYTLERHTFHIHQTHFRDITAGANDRAPVLDSVAVPQASRASTQGGIDVADVPGFVRLRMLFTRANIGTFVFHCHIGEHVDNGMMQRITVTD